MARRLIFVQGENNTNNAAAQGKENGTESAFSLDMSVILLLNGKETCENMNNQLAPGSIKKRTLPVVISSY